MRNFFDWAKAGNITDKPWLILGKGPSFSLKGNYDLTRFHIMVLNHVIREQKAKLSHVIDFDVADTMATVIYENAEFLVMPYYPHINNLPTDQNVETLIMGNPTLKKLNEEGRILWYHKCDVNVTPEKEYTRRIRQIRQEELADDGYPLVPVHYFSAEAAVNLLAMSDVKMIRSLGLDGGSSYSNKFDDIKDKTLLANGQKTFDLQNQPINVTLMEKKIDYAPLNANVPVKIYVGAMEQQMLAVKVLEYSVKKHTTLPVEVFPLYKAGIEIPMPKDPKNRPRTPFSFQRFFIPQLNQFKGRAIYMDSDMQVFADIGRLWSKDMQDAEVLSAYEQSGTTGRKPQFAVMLMDCSKLQWSVEDIVKKLDNNELTYETLMFDMAVAKKVNPVIENEWNSLEHYEENVTCNLHYTDMITQPWLYTNNKNSHIWIKELLEAVSVNAISKAYIKSEVLQGHVRPSLLYQVKHKVPYSKNISKRALWLDKYFIPPHEKASKNSAWLRFKAKSSALIAYLYF